MDKKTLMESLAREAHEKGGFNGAWLYAEHGEIVSKGAMGFRDPDNTLPIQEDTIFQLASVSKQFTATAVMLLLREGLLCLEDILPGAHRLRGRNGPSPAHPHRRRARLL